MAPLQTLSSGEVSLPRWGLGFEQYSSRPITRVSQDGVVNVFRRLLLRRHAFPPILPGLHFAAVEAEKVEGLPPIPNIDHLGFRRMERQPQTAEDDLDAPGCLACLCLRPAQQDGIVGIPDQLTQLTTAVLSDPIQLVEHHVRQYA